MKLPDRDWAMLVAEKHFLELPVPDARGWHVDRRGEWLAARHPASSSRLEVRSWREPRGTTASSCEQDARLGRPDLPEVASESVVEEQIVDVPAGYRTRLYAGIEPRPDDRIAGFVLAFGAGVRRCLAVVFTTEVRSSAPEREAAERLALMVNGSLRRMRARGVDDRATERMPFDF